MTSVISVENVSKFYKLGLIGGGTLRDDLQRGWARLRGQPDPLLKIGEADHGNRSDEYIWALRDVSFQVEQGEVLGIIGRNGAGKSTLLKILSRVTAPTSGRIRVKGRIASLLEVGTGFHPELTGRENVYLNGTILGMKRKEIDRKFDEIVEFAEISQFIDTPVKRYSSGMYVRLAFAVAAHLDPEILLVDEVLAVGDAAFQKKCLGKMGDVARDGRTVLFVSHNMASVSALCNEVIVFHHGSIFIRSETQQAISAYLNVNSQFSSQGGVWNFRDIQERKGNGDIRFIGFHCEVGAGEPASTLFSGQKVSLVLDYEGRPGVDLHNAGVSIIVYTSDGIRLTNLWSEYREGKPFDEIPDSGRFVCTFPAFPFRAGRYVIDVYCYANSMTADWIQYAASLDVVDGDYYGSGKISQNTNGVVFLDHEWSFQNDSSVSGKV